MAESWSYKGDWITSCNCDYGCPCNFNARPSHGNCEGIIALKIRDGSYGAVSLKGLSVGSAVWWPGAIHEGNGVAQIYITKKATPEQQHALQTILKGDAGGKPWGILGKTITTYLPTKTAKVTFRPKKKETVFKVEGHIDVQAEAIKNPVTQAESFYEVRIANPLIFGKGEFFSNKVHTVTEPAHAKLNWSYPSRYFALAKVAHSGP